jgi:hypothetical protein
LRDPCALRRAACGGVEGKLRLVIGRERGNKPAWLSRLTCHAPSSAASRRRAVDSGASEPPREFGRSGEERLCRIGIAQHTATDGKSARNQCAAKQRRARGMERQQRGISSFRVSASSTCAGWPVALVTASSHSGR